MSKRLVSIALTISLILGMSSVPVGATQPKSSVALNAATAILENGFYIDELGQVMYPLRQCAEQLDYLTIWNEKDNSIVVSGESDVVELKIGEPSVTVNGKDLKMVSSPIMKEGKTFVPIEFLSNALDLIVGWNNKQQTLQINQPKENTEGYFAISEDAATQDKLDTYMKALQKHENFHGSILVAKEGKILINEGYGFSDLHQNTNNKSQTKFAIGSVTKQFTAMAIMQLNEKGLISVDDKISKYIGDFPNGDLITIHNLLTHTSGLKNYTELAGFLTVSPENKDPMVMANLIKDMPLEFQPGEQFKYSNTNYLLLGIIIEKITGRPLEDYLKQNIFDPLNMKDTGMSYSENNQSYDATAYSGYLEVVPVDDEALAQSYGAGNMYSTVEDLYRWDRALQTEQLVQKSTMDEIFKEHTAMSEQVAYGYGWMIGDDPIGKRIFHGGNTLGFTANIVRYIDEDMTIIILTNNAYYNVDGLADTLTSITLGREYQMPVALTEIKISNPDLYDSYVGRYEFISGTYMDIIKEDNNLYAQFTGQGIFEIFPETDSKFFAKSINMDIEFIINDNEEVTQAIFEQLGMKIVCNRAEEKEIVDVDLVVYDSYVGEYELAPGAIISILKEDKQLFAQLTGQDKFEIFPMSESEYFYKIIDANISFIKGPDGNVINLVLHQNGQDMPAPKIK